MNQIEQTIQKVRRRVTEAELRFQRQPGSVDILAVSKSHSIEDIRKAYEVGQHKFGENRVQEALPKIAQLKDLTACEWHFIGPIQSNKTQPIAESFSWVHSVDRDPIAKRLSDQRPHHLPPLNVCLQVNVSNEAQKSGVSLAELDALVQAVAQYPNLVLRGLMCIPENTSEFDQQRKSFSILRQAYERLRHSYPLDTLSMGMSQDLEAAIAEGATLVRIGTAIFGTSISH